LKLGCAVYPREEVCSKFAVSHEKSSWRKKGERGLKSLANTAAVPEIGKSVGTIEEARASAEREVGEDDDDDDGDDDATNDKQRANRSEAVSYAANDEDDDRVQAQMQKEAEPEEDDEEMEDEGIEAAQEILRAMMKMKTEQEWGQRQVVSDAAEEREAQVMKHCSDIVRFRFDETAGEWCEITLEYAADVPKVLMLSIVEDALRQSLIQQIPGLGTCTYVDEEVKDPATGKLVKIPSYTQLVSTSRLCKLILSS